jgi:hypothetical protein
MEYEKFIEAFDKCLIGIERIKTLSSLPAKYWLSRIPESFACTFPSIVSVINSNLKAICDNRWQTIALYTLEPAGLAIVNREPNPNRIVDPKNREHHFCCFLKYMLLDKKRLKTVTKPNEGKIIVVDFTTGLIMNIDQYFYILKIGKNPGAIYGGINEAQLTAAWEHFNKTSKGYPYGVVTPYMGSLKTKKIIKIKK